MSRKNRGVHVCGFSQWLRSSSDGSWGMLFWHNPMSCTRIDCRERICSLSGQLVKLPTFIDTPIPTGESKGQGRSVGKAVVTGSTWQLSDDEFTPTEDECKKWEDLCQGWWLHGGLVWPRELTWCYSAFTAVYVDVNIAIVISQSLDQQSHKEQGLLQYCPCTKSSTILSESVSHFADLWP